MSAQVAIDQGRSFGEFVADNRDAIIVRPIRWCNWQNDKRR